MQDDEQKKSEAEDKWWMAKAQGDRVAFDKLFDKHRDYLMRCCYRILNNQQDAEDIVEETSIQAWKRRDQYEATGNVRAWLYRIAINLSLNFLRKRHDIAPLDESIKAAVPSVEKQVLKNLENDEAYWKRLVEQLEEKGELNDIMILLCRLHYQHGITHDEAANLLKLNANTVGAWFKRKIIPAVKKVMKEKS